MPNPSMKESRSHFARHTRHLLTERQKAAAKLGVTFATVDFGERQGGEFCAAYLGGEFVEFRLYFLFDDKGRVYARAW